MQKYDTLLNTRQMPQSSKKAFDITNTDYKEIVIIQGRELLLVKS